jgi:hypothetical protein
MLILYFFSYGISGMNITFIFFNQFILFKSTFIIYVSYY